MSVEHFLLKRVDEQRCIDFLEQMIRHKSYSETDGERELAVFMQGAMQGLPRRVDLRSTVTRRFNQRLPTEGRENLLGHRYKIPELVRRGNASTTRFQRN